MRRDHLRFGNWIADYAGGHNIDLAYGYNDMLPIIQKPAPNKVYLIDFYANWCQPCLEFKPVFTALAMKWELSKYKKFYDNKGWHVEFITFDCAGTHRNGGLCQSQGVPHYPYIEFRHKQAGTGQLKKQAFQQNSYSSLEAMVVKIANYLDGAGAGGYHDEL